MTLTTKKIAILTIVVLVFAAAVIVANPTTMPFMYHQEAHNHKECEHGQKHEKSCSHEHKNECNCIEHLKINICEVLKSEGEEQCFTGTLVKAECGELI